MIGVRVRVKNKLIYLNHFSKAIKYIENDDLQVYKSAEVDKSKIIR